MPPELHGYRLDAAAARLFDRHSRSRLQYWIAHGHLRVNSRIVTVTRQNVRGGDELRLKAPVEAVAVVAPQKMVLDVVYEDADLAVINKPAGLTVHPGAGRPDGTLQNALAHRWPQTTRITRNGIVHRLDMDTSGLLVVALSERAHMKLVEAMQRHDVHREYDALVLGIVTGGGTCRAALGRHPRDRVKIAVVANGRPAITHYRVLERFPNHTHLRVRLETGRTHQIRVHMAYLRHPVLGDPVYGGRVQRGIGMPDSLRTLLATFPRQALHARELAFKHPVTGARLTFTREPPDDMQALIVALRKNRDFPGRDTP